MTVSSAIFPTRALSEQPSAWKDAQIGLLDSLYTNGRLNYLPKCRSCVNVINRNTETFLEPILKPDLVFNKKLRPLSCILFSVKVSFPRVSM